ncbi:FMN-linked oxidoreductase [Teratosphaeria nubilosa]|uniref:FMN-linked oxidoreductase n=1 Tax=Teratosphaeria nubilosa TaxID=161662 RepID=A0A6G1L8Z7_9PEZI|nr:FMN-linked oxidoreductase [Teratosphaeria nubilosa]
MSRLFTPIGIGHDELAHRVAMAPLTRYRCDENFLPMPIVKEYYVQRACVPGTLIISEATMISERHAGKLLAPGIWSTAQIEAWRDIVDAVHAKGCKMWCQLWAQGRAGNSEDIAATGTKLMSASAVPLSAEGSPTPAEMTEDEIHETINEYAQAAKKAIEAGFDGVEVHGGNGYLPDQFLQDTCNKRSDVWGGSIENRCRFHLEVTKAIIAAVGPERMAMRLSPWSDFLDMLMDDPVPTFTHLVSELKKLNIGFLDLIQARIRGNDDSDVAADKDVSWLIQLWGNMSPVLLSGGFTAESAKHAVDVEYAEYDVGIIFGRYFTSNPDLVYRIKEGVPMTKYDRSTFYTPKLAKGYVDWDYSANFTTCAYI